MSTKIFQIRESFLFIMCLKMIFYKLIAFLLILCMMQRSNYKEKQLMKKFLLLILSTLLCSQTAYADEPNYKEEVESLGFVSGQGLACQASKYDTYELLARAILVSKARSDAMQEEGMRAYNSAKAEAFISKIKDNFANCGEIADSFDQQKIFKMVLYGDGTIKMPDGKIIKPRQAYDVSFIYQKDPEARQKMIDMYKTQHEKIIKDPKYQKALRERQLEVGF